MKREALGWTITVQLPDKSAPQIFNVAISEERGAIEAVKQALPDAKGAIVKVKSELFERVYKGLGMRPGDVLQGAQRRRKPKAGAKLAASP